MLINTDKQTRNFFLYACFSAIFFESSVMTILLQTKGLSLSAISVLVGAYSVGVFIFEYLTGIVADKYSRKSVLVLSTIFIIVGEVIFIVGRDFWSMFIGFTCLAVSVSAKSGADIALIYDYMSDQGRAESFGEFMSLLGSVCMTLCALAAFSGPFLIRNFQMLPLVATTVCALISLIFLIQLKDNNRYKAKRSFKGVVKKSISEFTKSKSNLAVLMYSVVMFPCFHVLTWILQPFLLEKGFQIEALAYVFLSFTLIQALGTRFANKISVKLGWKKSLFLSSMGIASVFVLITLPINHSIALAILVAGLSFGVFYTVNSIALNHQIESENRASTLSLQHAITKVAQMFVFSILGLLVNRIALDLVFLGYGLTLILIVFTLFVLHSKAEVPDKEDLLNVD